MGSVNEMVLWEGEIQMCGGRAPGQKRKARLLRRDGSCLNDIPEPRGIGLRLETYEPRSGDWRRTLPSEIDAVSLVMSLAAAAGAPLEATAEVQGEAR